jgi:glycosyltransferase involved in cell wall biosynthesis
VSHKPRRILFLQVTEPGAYPPIMNAATLLADAGWDVTVLSSPSANLNLAMPEDPRIRLRSLRLRPSYRVGKLDYGRYCLAAAQLALGAKPQIIYASDPLGAGPGLLAARLAGARLIYHEHDSFNPGTNRPPLSQTRRAAARAADLVIFPNEDRARIAQTELNFPDERLRIVWNLPRRSEIPSPAAQKAEPLIAYYHGSITPDRLPLALIEGGSRLRGRVRLRIAGYEAPGAPGYVARLIEAGRSPGGEPMVEYLGQLPQRRDLLGEAARAHVGLAFMPRDTGDINMDNMTGASNKAFDYMAAGLALLVTDRPDWRRLFVPDFAKACDPSDPASFAAALAWFIDNPSERRAMAERGRAGIRDDWNYETAFAPIMAAFDSLVPERR